MKVIIFFTLFLQCNVYAQVISWSDYDVDTTVVAGTEVIRDYHLQITDSNHVYNCTVKAENINFPASWHYTICTPFSCLASDISTATFNYPDVDNYDFFNNGFGGSVVTLHVYTSTGPAILTGELDLVFKNNETNETNTNHVIVRTNGQSLSVEMNEKNTFFQNPVINSIELISHKTEFVEYEIIDLNGIKVSNGTIENNKIECMNLNSGIYFIKIQSTEKQTFISKFFKL
ncbi:MAG: T9SS type A sorting domain-containing protein [Fluviicola sp.]|jgi:hypothetical protein